MRCQECENKANTLYDDPRSPPLDMEPCLCDDCFVMAAEQVVDELQSKIDDLEHAKRHRQRRGVMRVAS